MINALYMNGQCSLGDAIVSNAIVHHYGDQCQKLYYSVLPQFLETLQCLYQDFPHIHVFVLPEGQNCETFCKENHLSYVKRADIEQKIIARQNIEPEVIIVAWMHQIYANSNISYMKRYTDFRLPQNIANSQNLYNTLNPSNEPFILVHKSSSTSPSGMPILIDEWRQVLGMPSFKIIEIQEGITNNMLDYMELIKRAREIHCVASSFFCLVDSIAKDLKADLFFHDARRNDLFVINTRGNNFKWKVVEYSTRS